MDDLIGPPARWHARAALADGAYAFGDDDTAATATADAARLIETFAASLSSERAAKLHTAPVVAHVLSSAGRSSVA